MTPHRRLKAYVLWAQVASVNSIGFSPLPTAPVDDPDTKLGQDCYIVRDANGHALAYVYFEAEPRRCPLLSRRIVSGHRRPIDSRPVAGPRRVSRPQIADASGYFRSMPYRNLPTLTIQRKANGRLVPSVTCGAERLC
jgi:hypothetical protein